MRPLGTIAIELWLGSIAVGVAPSTARALTELLYGLSPDGAERFTEELFFVALVTTGSALVSFFVELTRGDLRNATLNTSLTIGLLLSSLCFMVSVIGYGGATSDRSVGTAYALAIVTIPIALSASFLLRVSVANIAAQRESHKIRAG